MQSLALNHPAQPTPSQTGFTLVELLVVIAIVAIMATMAAPMFRDMMQRNAVNGSINTFYSDFRFARSEGMRRGGNVILCQSDNPEAAVPLCNDNGLNWQTGWIIFQDRNANNQFTAADGDELLRIQSAQTAIDSIRSNTPAIARFEFTATGRLRFGASTLCFGGNNIALNMRGAQTISPQGHMRRGDIAECPP